MLDEPTSGLDAESEQLVFDALGRLMKGKTSIVIAHHLATIRAPDVIYVMRDGAIAEQGDARRAARKGGLYAELHELQFCSGSRLNIVQRSDAVLEDGGEAFHVLRRISGCAESVADLSGDRRMSKPAIHLASARGMLRPIQRRCRRISIGGSASSRRGRGAEWRSSQMRVTLVMKREDL